MLIFVRHGIRGIEGGDVLLAEGENLSLYGQMYSYKLGKYIRKTWGEIDFIYPDNNTERTIATGIAIAKGNRVDSLYMSEEKPDPFFSVEKGNEGRINERFCKAMNEIERLAEMVGMKVEGMDTMELLEEMSKKANLPCFYELSGVNTDIPKCIEKVFDIKERILYSDVAKEKGEEMMRKIFGLLRNKKLSVLIGHDESNIALLSLYFKKLFSAKGYSPGYIPPNSGFIFTLHNTSIKVEILYLTSEGKFKMKPYKKVQLTNEQSISNLKKYKV